MDLIQNQKSVLNWLATADTRSRCDLVKLALGMLNENELKRCLSKVSKCRTKFKKKLPKTISEPKDKLRRHSYRPANVVALDCEHAHYQGLKSIKRMKAATVTIVNSKSEVIYHAKVLHEPGSFMVNTHTKKVTGFTRDLFVDGRPLEEISEEVASLLEDKLVIVHNVATDFSSLDLFMGDFDVFDLTCHFQKDNGQRSKYEEIIYQLIDI